MNWPPRDAEPSPAVEGLAANHYHDRHFERAAVKILPGEYYATGGDMLLVTVLGSCVAACIHDHENGIGGMNHFMLPGGAEGGAVSRSARYGTYAMELLINQLMKLGARRDRLQAKVFGGGTMLDGVSLNNVGARNAEFVTGFLEREHIPVVARDLLAAYPRKVYYFPASGRVLVRKLLRIHNDTVFARERDYRQRIEQAPASGDVELFL